MWTASGGGGDYAGKPRPVVIIQDDTFHDINSITVCGFTSKLKDTPLFRILVQPSPQNGLRSPCSVMVDKIVTLPRSKIGDRIGRLEDEEMALLNRAIALFLGLAASRS